ncbi:MAG TPA: hypothetical protein VEG65_07380 [Candidatus Bathyarchaeia archaeon]|nr:hypothetical protein [Candidatus Bathyarchaeia archaeon]
MKADKLRELFKTVLFEMNKELKSYAWLFCAERGFSVSDSILFVDDAGLLPEIRAALTPTLRYDLAQLANLVAELENDLNNIVFEYAYNRRYNIGGEDRKTIERMPSLNEHVLQLMSIAQN